VTTLNANLRPIDVVPGVQPETDRTPLATQHYTYAKGIRFQNGFPQKIGGNRIFNFNDGAEISGTARSVFSAQLTNNEMLIGTNEKLYSVQGSVLTNITPLKTATTTIANSIDTHYATLAADPLSVTNGSKTITVTDPEAALLQPGDIVTLSGATTTGGIPDTDINDDHIVRSIVDATHLTIMVPTAATSTTTGGGASVVRTSGLLTFSAVAHAQLDGDRVGILAAATTGGIADTLINGEHIVRNATANTFDIMTTGTASSAVTAGGGASTTYQVEIDPGALDQNVGQGYGLGLYGVGLYGVSKTSGTANSLPRIWFMDRFADTIILTPGNQGGVYEWGGDEDVAPVLLSGAPATANYVFVSNNIVVTFGYNGTPNRIFASDQGDPTEWTASSTNQVFEDNIEGAGRLLSSVPVNGLNLIFTQNQTYTFRYIGLPFIWEILPLDLSVGIIGPMARCTTKGIAFWMGLKNFYMWRGGNVEIIPANSQAQSTILNYIFNDLNSSQQTKIFAWYNYIFDEVWFHIPSANSNEPDTVARVNLQDFTWVPDEMDRTAAEYPINLFILPRLMDTDILRVHEDGTDDDTLPLEFELTSNLRLASKNNTYLAGFIPDSRQISNITTNIMAKRFPQSTSTTFDRDYTVTPTDEQIPVIISGRYWKYTWSGAELGQTWAMGAWQEWFKEGPRQ
jgi:hypothetical protein